MSPDSLCRWQVQVSVYCAGQIPVHLRCTECSILVHLIDICFLLCICLWQKSRLVVVLLSDLDLSRHVVVIDLPLLRVAVEGSDNSVSLEKPCQASLPPDQQGRHSLGRHPEVQYVA